MTAAFWNETGDESARQQVGNMSLPIFDETLCEEDVDKMMKNAQRASNFLKAISQEGD